MHRPTAPTSDGFKVVWKWLHADLMLLPDKWWWRGNNSWFISTHCTSTYIIRSHDWAHSCTRPAPVHLQRYLFNILHPRWSLQSVKSNTGWTAQRKSTSISGSVQKDPLAGCQTLVQNRFRWFSLIPAAKKAETLFESSFGGEGRRQVTRLRMKLRSLWFWEDLFGWTFT